MASPIEAPAPAVLAPAPAPAKSSRAAVPWLAGGAVALAAAGTALCIGGHEISNDLDAKFAAGTLTPADQPRYGKSRAEGIAGTSMLIAAGLAAAAALVLAW